MERRGNGWSRVEGCVSAWVQGIRSDAESEGGADDLLIGASAEPSKRPRTFHWGGSGRCAGSPRAGRERERAGALVWSSPGYGVGEDAMMLGKFPCDK